MALMKFKRSAVPAKVPSIADLDLGEMAINTYDGKVYTKKDNGTQSIVQVGGGTGGGVETITSTDGSVVITGTTDIDLSVPVAASTQTVILPVRNNTGATLVKGTAVYINGALGQNPTVTKAIATGDATSAQTLGLVTANIAHNAVGNVTLIGSLTNLDTSAYTDGEQLYLSPTTAGALTATKPYAPNHLVYMAVVEHAHPSLGKLFVKVQNGYEMDELHNVAARTPSNNDGLFYNTSTSLWESKSIITALGYTPYDAANPSGYLSTVNLTSDVTGTLPASSGGTGITAVGAVGNVLTSDGTAWVSQSPASGGLTYTEVKTANFTAAVNTGVQTNTSGGAFTVTLPASPTVGAQVVVVDSANSWGTNNLTIARNGSTIEGSATNLTCDISGVSVQLVYSGTTWDVYAQAGGAGGSAIPYPSAGIAVSTGTAWAASLTAPSGSLVGTSDAQTLTNKRITSRVSSAASFAATLAWNSDSFDQYAATAQANGVTISADAGTPTDGQKMVFRVVDNGTTRNLVFTGGVSKGFRPVGVTLTTSGSDFSYNTVANKAVYFGMIYNSAAARWDIIAIAQEA